MQNFGPENGQLFPIRPHKCIHVYNTLLSNLGKNFFYSENTLF